MPFRVREATLATFSTCAVLASLTLLLGGCAGSRAVGRAGDHLLWSRDDRAYVALHDGAVVAEGDSVRFDEGRTMVAAGHVESVVHGELALVTITAGSLGAAARPERLLVSVMPQSTPHLGSVRVALPANGRGNLLVRCGGVAPHLPAEAPPYRSETLDARHLRLTRSGEAASSNGWSDTLDIVLFDDASDEEIALERGEVDVAVFWPGEGSRRARTDPRWRGFPLGVRAGSVLALTGPGDVAHAAPDSIHAGAFNAALFQNDLELLPSALGPSDYTWRGAPWIVRPDAGLPGSGIIWGWMTRTALMKKPSPAEEALHPHLALVDSSADSARSGIVPLFALRCPVLCAEPMRRWVDAVGADALASMVQCR
ncbi:MAG: hypothetical protein ACM3PF_03995 [Bacteroidota bacterium]